MKKRNIVLLSIFTLLLCISLSACGEKKIEGSYKATADLKESLNKSMDGIITVKEIKVDFYLDFTGPSDYHMYTKEDQIKDSLVAAFTDALKDTMSEKEIRTFVDRLDTSRMVLSEKGSYEMQGDKILFDPKSDAPQEAKLKKNGDIEMKIAIDEDQTLDLLFQK